MTPWSGGWRVVAPAFTAQLPATTAYAPEQSEGFAGACRASFGKPSWVSLRVLTTRKATAMEGRPARPEKAYEIWVSESRASGASVAEAKGPWRAAVTIEYGPNAPMRAVLAGDDGVMAWIEAGGEEGARVVPLAAALVEGLRAER